MAEIFLSYASQDRDRIRPLVAALEADGFDVWWDRNIQPGPTFDREIEQAIAASRCVVVAWSVHAVESEWVRSEVEEGARRGILIPLLLDDVLPPLAHRRRQAADLSDWDGQHDEAYEQLVAAIRATLARSSGADGDPALPPDPTMRRRKRARTTFGPVSVALLFLLALALGAGLNAWMTTFLNSGDGPRRASGDGRPAPRFLLELPDDWELGGDVREPLAITSDGAHLVVSVQRGGEQAYLARPFASVEATVVPDVLGAGSITAAGGPWILNYRLSAEAIELRRFRVPEGGSELVAELPESAVGVSVAGDGRIAVGTIERGILLIDPAAGTTEGVTKVDDDVLHGLPVWIDEGRKLLYVVVPRGRPDMAERGTIRVLDLVTGEDRALLAGTQPIVTASGHLLFAHSGYVWATAFDPARAVAYGERTRFFEWVPRRYRSAGTPYVVSDDGTLIHAQDSGDAGAQVARYEWGWLGLDGHFERVEMPLDNAINPRLDGEDRFVLLNQIRSAGNVEIWKQDLTRDRTARVSYDNGFNAAAAWATGDRFVYAHAAKPFAPSDLYLSTADGGDEPRRITEGWQAMAPDVAPDGDTVVFETCDQDFEICELARVGLQAGATPERIVSGDADHETPVISRDGRWLAYASDESGRLEIYVRPWPDVNGGRWQVSIDGGWLPVWAKEDDRLFFVEPTTNRLMATTIEAGAGFSSTRPEALLDLSGYSAERTRRVNLRNFDIDRSGERLLISRSPSRSNRLVVVLDWFEELERLAPTRH